MHLTIKRFITGPIDTNTYVLSQSDSSCIIIDPSGGCNNLLDYIKNEKLSPKAICLTHGHFDHFMGIEEILDCYPGIDIYAHPTAKVLIQKPEYNGSYMIGTQLSYNGPIKELNEGIVSVGGFELNVLYIPGHSPGGCAFVIEKNCFSGDSLFAGSVGRIDFPGCDGQALISSIKEKLFTLPEDTVVYPGHGGRTTIAREKLHNPFLI